MAPTHSYSTVDGDRHTHPLRMNKKRESHHRQRTTAATLHAAHVYCALLLTHSTHTVSLVLTRPMTYSGERVPSSCSSHSVIQLCTVFSITLPSPN